MRTSCQVRWQVMTCTSAWSSSSSSSSSRCYHGLTADCLPACSPACPPAQVDTAGDQLTSCHISSSGECITFGGSGGYVHMFAASATPKVSSCAEALLQCVVWIGPACQQLATGPLAFCEWSLASLMQWCAVVASQRCV
jgi:hypothetical protein